MTTESKCPFSASSVKTTASSSSANQAWWPEQLNLNMLHQHSPKSNPMGTDFSYTKAFNSLDLESVVNDLHTLMTDSQD